MRVITAFLAHQVLLIILFLCCSVLPAYAAITNRTIDDTFGDPFTGQEVLFLPTTPGVWKGANCTDCLINPDITQTLKGTYTAATYNTGLGSINFTLNFHGTAIYAFFVLANNAGAGVTTLTAVNFTLDNGPPQLRLHAPDVNSRDLQYNSLLFSQTGLPATQHTLLVSTSGVDNSVYVNFDYAIYTHDDAAVVAPVPSSTAPASTTVPASASISSGSSQTTTASSTQAQRTTTTPPSKPAATSDTSQQPTHTGKKGLEDQSATSKPNGGAIAGGIIAALVAVGLIIFLVLFFLRRRRKRLDTEQLLFKRVEIDPSSPIRAPDSDLGHGGGMSSDSGHSTVSMRPVYYNTAEASATRLTLQVPVTRPPPMSQIPVTPSDAGDPYGGYVTPTETVVSIPNPWPKEPPRRPVLQLVNRSSGVPTLASSISNHEDLRRARQDELNRQLAEMHEEMRELSSGLEAHAHASGSSASGQEGRNSPPQYVKRVSVKSLRHLKSAAGIRGDTDGGNEEISVEQMQELIRSLRRQIEYLQAQQQSAWAQGLSDDPPPGYTPMASRRMSPLTDEKHRGRQLT